MPSNQIEPLLEENQNVYTLFPIKDTEIFQAFKRQQASLWTSEELDLAADKRDWESLTANEQTFLKRVLAFFAVSDGVVSENLVHRFSNEVQLPEARCAYAVQIYVESVHSETYSLLVDTYITDKKEKEDLFNAARTIPSIGVKVEWAKKYIDNDAPFATRLVAFAVVEGIFFCASFAAVFYFKGKQKLVNGLGLANEFISRDESEHTRFACLLYSKLVNKLTTREIHSIIKGGVKVEKAFVRDTLKVSLLGLNADTMCTYVEYVADTLCHSLGVLPIYNAKNPLLFMESISLEEKSNFFEKRVSSYQLSGVMDSARIVSSGGRMGEKQIEAKTFCCDVDF